MLVLTRAEGQEIVIGDPRAPLGRIRLEFAAGGKAKIGFDFPRETQISRLEVANEMRQQAGDAPLGHIDAPGRLRGAT